MHDYKTFSTICRFFSATGYFHTRQDLSHYGGGYESGLGLGFKELPINQSKLTPSMLAAIGRAEAKVIAVYTCDIEVAGFTVVRYLMRRGADVNALVDQSGEIILVEADIKQPSTSFDSWVNPYLVVDEDACRMFHTMLVLTSNDFVASILGKLLDDRS